MLARERERLVHLLGAGDPKHALVIIDVLEVEHEVGGVRSRAEPEPQRAQPGSSSVITASKCRLCLRA